MGAETNAWKSDEELSYSHSLRDPTVWMLRIKRKMVTWRRGSLADSSSINVSKLHVTCGGASGHCVPSDTMHWGKHSAFRDAVAKNVRLESNRREASAKAKLSDVLPHNWPILLKSVRVMKAIRNEWGAVPNQKGLGSHHDPKQCLALGLSLDQRGKDICKGQYWGKQPHLKGSLDRMVVFVSMLIFWFW